jgi:hypothetical protein
VWEGPGGGVRLGGELWLLKRGEVRLGEVRCMG